MSGLSSVDAVVIGGGVTGLTAAYALKQLGKRFVIFEPESVGGVLRSVQKEGFTLEAGPNVFLEKHQFPSFLKELGLEKQKRYPVISDYAQYVWSRRGAAPKGMLSAPMIAGGPLAVPRGLFPFLTTRLLTSREKVRCVRGLFQKFAHENFGDDASVAQFIGTLFGGSTVREILEPALQGIYGSPADLLSARSILPGLWDAILKGKTPLKWLADRKRANRLVTSENQASSQTSSSKSPKIFTLSGGNSLIIQSLYESLPERVCLREAVIGIEQVTSESPACKGRFLVRGWNTQILTSKVIIATAGSATSKFISTLSPDLAGKFSSMLFVPLNVIHCAVSSSMPWLSKGFGVLFPPGAPRGLLGIMANSVLFPEVAPSRAHLLTVMLRGLAEEDFGGESPESAAVASIKEFLGFGVDEVLLTTRWERAIPQLSVGSWRLQAAMDECEANFSGLRFIGVDRGGVGVPDRVGMALSAVRSEFQGCVG